LTSGRAVETFGALRFANVIALDWQPCSSVGDKVFYFTPEAEIFSNFARHRATGFRSDADTQTPILRWQ
jgi:hypothetical protein